MKAADVVLHGTALGQPATATFPALTEAMGQRADETRAERLHALIDEIEQHLMGAPREVLTADIEAIYRMLLSMAWPGHRPEPITAAQLPPGHTVCMTCDGKGITPLVVEPESYFPDLQETAPPKDSRNQVAGQACNYPHCGCPFDHPGTEGWCAQGRPAA